MRSANQAQVAGSILVAEYFGISSLRVFRKLSVVYSLPAKPMMANCLERRLSAARLHSAGISLRYATWPRIISFHSRRRLCFQDLIGYALPIRRPRGKEILIGA